MDAQIDIDTPVLDPELEEGERVHQPRVCWSCSWAEREPCCKAATRCSREGTPDGPPVASWLDRWRPEAPFRYGTCGPARDHTVRHDPPPNADDCPGYCPTHV